jgi:serine O-acetyltransferase
MIMYAYMVARTLYTWRVPLLPGLIKWLVRLAFGAYIPPSAEIGERTQLGYLGMGIVIHNRAVIGPDCLIMQQVTIGGTSGVQQVPRLGKGVYVGAGARILGDVTIGDYSVIGANAVVVKSIPAHCLAVGVPAKVIKEGVDARDYR